MPRRSLHGTILSIAGAIALAVGTYLPWLRTNPALPPDVEIATILLPGMRAGIEGLDVALLGGAGIVLALHVVGSRERTRSLFTLLLGGGSLLLCFRYQFYYAGVGGEATFVPAPGWHVTVLGGALLAAAGGVRWPSVLEGNPGASDALDE